MGENEDIHINDEDYEDIEDDDENNNQGGMMNYFN